MRRSGAALVVQSETRKAPGTHTHQALAKYSEGHATRPVYHGDQAGPLLYACTETRAPAKGRSRDRPAPPEGATNVAAAYRACARRRSPRRSESISWRIPAPPNTATNPFARLGTPPPTL